MVEIVVMAGVRFRGRHRAGGLVAARCEGDRSEPPRPLLPWHKVDRADAAGTGVLKAPQQLAQNAVA
jgi:hypothetical protein